MARYHAPEDDTIVYKITRRKLIFVFTALVLIMIAVFITGIFIGRGQRVVESEVQPPPVIVQSEPEPTKPQDIPIEPLPSDEGVPIDQPEPEKPGTMTTQPEPVSPPPRKAEKPEPRTPAPVTTPVTQKKGFILQIIATSQPDKAERLARNLQSLGFPAFIDRTQAGLHRVMVGPYNTREEAEKALDILRPHLPRDVSPLIRSQS